MTKAAAIVPAFNEEKTVGDVVRTLVASKVFDEVIVISDGSDDRTAQVAREAGATMVHELPFHKGLGKSKGQAIEHGVTHTDANVIAFFDADLIGFTPEHAKLVVGPVLAGTRSMNAGWRDRGPVVNFLQRFMPLIGGERAMERQIFETIPNRFVRGFMIEAATNYYCRANGLPYGGTLLPGLTMRKKYQKVGWPRAIKEYVCMYGQVAKAMVYVRLHRKDFCERFIHEKHHD
jgi:glycosyltransferase involved in cell wall biosynthesis